MPALRIADLLANPLVDPSAHLEAEQVERHARDPVTSSPVVVFETEAGRLLADGYHRVAAAQQRGAETVEAELRKGSLEEALRYAAEVGARQRGISVDPGSRRHQPTQPGPLGSEAA